MAEIGVDRRIVRNDNDASQGRAGLMGKIRFLLFHNASAVSNRDHLRYHRREKDNDWFHLSSPVISLSKKQ
jgi:hypothetical protein